MSTSFKSLLLVALLATLSVVTFAGPQGQTPADKAVAKTNKVTATVTIKAIDPATRSVTLRAENGDEDTFTVGPEVTRFDQLKAGDTIKATYYEALVFQVRKPGDPAPPSGGAAGGRLKDVPGVAVGAQKTATVTVKAVDASVPSITVVTADGRTMTRKITDKKNLEGVSAGDKIDISYAQALVVAAEPAKK